MPRNDNGALHIIYHAIAYVALNPLINFVPVVHRKLITYFAIILEVVKGYQIICDLSKSDIEYVF